MCHFTESILLIRYSEASGQIQRHNEINWHFYMFFDCVDYLQAVGTGELDNFLQAVDTGELDDYGPEDRVTWLSAVCPMKYAHYFVVVTSSLLVVSCHAFAHILMFFFMMMSSNKNISALLAPLCGEFTGHRWIPLTKASDAERWCLLWFAPEQTAE